MKRRKFITTVLGGGFLGVLLKPLNLFGKELSRDKSYHPFIEAPYEVGVELALKCNGKIFAGYIDLSKPEKRNSKTIMKAVEHLSLCTTRKLRKEGIIK